MAKLKTDAARARDAEQINRKLTAELGKLRVRVRSLEAQVTKAAPLHKQIAELQRLLRDALKVTREAQRQRDELAEEIKRSLRKEAA